MTVILSEAKNQVFIFQFILNRIIKITGLTGLKYFNRKERKVRNAKCANNLKATPKAVPPLDRGGTVFGASRPKNS